MREIKFRAYVKSKYNAMCRVESINFCSDNKYDVIIKTADLFKSPAVALEYLAGQSIGNTEIKLMQYTGLKDKNGVEIYEGDIIKQTFESPDYWDGRDVDIDTYIGRVIFDEGELAYKVVDKNNKLIHYLHIFDNCKVIGNIYENPELLKDKK